MDSVNPIDAGPTAWPRLQKFLATADVQLLRDWQKQQNIALSEQRQQQIALSEKHEERMRLLTHGRDTPPSTVAATSSGTSIGPCDLPRHPGACRLEPNQSPHRTNEIKRNSADDRGSEELNSGGALVESPILPDGNAAPPADNVGVTLVAGTANSTQVSQGLEVANAMTNGSEQSEALGTESLPADQRPISQNIALTAFAAYDERPVKPLGDSSASFEELLSRRLRAEQEEVVNAPPVSTKPARQTTFLRRGQGIARFNKKPTAATSAQSNDLNTGERISERTFHQQEQALSTQSTAPGELKSPENGGSEDDQQLPTLYDLGSYGPNRSSTELQPSQHGQTAAWGSEEATTARQTAKSSFASHRGPVSAAPPRAHYNPKVYSDDERASCNDLESLLEFEMLEAVADDHSFSSQSSLVQGVLRRAVIRQKHAKPRTVSISPFSDVRASSHPPAGVPQPVLLAMPSSSAQSNVSRQLFRTESRDSGLASGSASQYVSSASPISSSPLSVKEDLPRDDSDRLKLPSAQQGGGLQKRWTVGDDEPRSSDDTDTTLEAFSDEKLTEDNAWEEEVVASSVFWPLSSQSTVQADLQRHTDTADSSPVGQSLPRTGRQEEHFGDENLQAKRQEVDTETQEHGPVSEGQSNCRSEDSDASSDDQIDSSTAGERNLLHSQPIKETLLEQKRQLHQLVVHHEQVVGQLEEQRRHLSLSSHNRDASQWYREGTQSITDQRRRSFGQQTGKALPSERRPPAPVHHQSDPAPSCPERSRSLERPVVPSATLPRASVLTRGSHPPAVFQETVEFADEPTPSQLMMKMFPALCLKPKPLPPQSTVSEDHHSAENLKASPPLAANPTNSVPDLNGQEAVQAKIQELELHVEKIVDLRLRRQRQELAVAVTEFEQQRDAEFASLEQEWKKLRTERRQFSEDQRRHSTVLARRDIEIAHLKDELSSVEERLRTFQLRETRLQTALARSKARSECLDKDNEELQAENKLLTNKLLRADEELKVVKAKLLQQENIPPSSTRQNGYFSGSKRRGQPLSSPQSTNANQQRRSSLSSTHSSPFEKSRSSNEMSSSTPLRRSSLVSSAGDDGALASLLSPETSLHEMVQETGSHDDQSLESVGSPVLPPKTSISGGPSSQPRVDDQPVQNEPNIESPLLKGQETVLSDGSRQVTLPNGTRQVVSPDGRSVVITFFNGDIKQILPDQRQVYFYAETQTTQTTYPDGIEVIEFANNQTETHYPDGTKEIHFPDGTVSYFMANGLERHIDPDGVVHQESADGEHIIEFPNGQREVHTSEFKRRECPDGTTKTVFTDGRQETRYASGRVRIKDAAGTVVFDSWADVPNSP